ncbi:hypothetical protein PSTG_15469 [Puccinia striiformis f. sp. tritici PST-78]|uniref:Uncharacterized protein n=1 Tax=Puccinia striiformis f. sp. tritici PST-78 TaxID=1165861 RepID=A0A0L0UVP7_9BASI|nr:hypothetical protein PSTG_15469 [Puccinia striiformis f. sp. tritici PST-78]
MWAVPQSNSDQALQPSKCSKLVALIIKENTLQQSSIARMHCWNIQVQFKLSEVRNTSTHVDVYALQLAQGGTVSNMYIGKILAASEHVSGKHCWVASATSRAKLSYISVQLFLYQPRFPMAAGFYTSSPKSGIFAHVEIVHLHHLFPITEGFNITEFADNFVSIPTQLQPLLLAMSEPQFLEHWEKELLRMKALKKK